MIGVGVCIGLAMLLMGFKLILMSLFHNGSNREFYICSIGNDSNKDNMSKKEMDDFIMFVFLVEQELACEIVYAPHYLKFEHSIIWAN
jgi:hypothetical protein